MKRTLIVDIINDKCKSNKINACGWIKTRRDAKNFFFLEINDGSCLESLQCIVDTNCECNNLLDLNTGVAISVTGQLLTSPGKGQKWELHANHITIFGLADKNFPLQKKRHSDEFLRTIAHLRARTNKYGAAFRVRSEAGYAIHSFLRKQHFSWVHTPLLTGSDCEGAGELFQVITNEIKNQTNLDSPPLISKAEKIKATKQSESFFKRPCYLTVSGQLEAEALAMGLGRVYTFGPTFRAENSNTTRHAAEFWMVEPEMAFADLEAIIELAENLTKSIIQHVLVNCETDLALFNQYVSKDLIAHLEKMQTDCFARITYSDAILLLQKCGQKFEYPVEFGTDLRTEHERWLVEQYFFKPVFIYNYPKHIKPFYMRLNDDGQTVAAVDMLVPGIGELVGGSQREERLEILMNNYQESKISNETYWWYTDLRRFGTAPHAGFGLGFERLLMLLTGINNIRDVIPFPRTPGSLEF